MLSMNFTRAAGNLSDEQIRHAAPSVFAETPWHAMSEKYAFVPTINVIQGLRSEGFNIVSARQSRSRIEGKGEFTKHMVRLRKSDQGVTIGDTFPEVVLVNSHDGTSAYTLHAGLFRLVCSNGMVCSIGNFGHYKTRHSGDIRGEVIDAAYRIVESFPELGEKAQHWKGITLTPQQQLAYAESAMPLRWDEEQNKPAPGALLEVRRYQDRNEQNTLWGTYNRVQEALIRGGNRYTGVNQFGQRSRRRTREVTGIDQDIKLNKALWTLTEKMAALV